MYQEQAKFHHKFQFQDKMKLFVYIGRKVGGFISTNPKLTVFILIFLGITVFVVIGGIKISNLRDENTQLKTQVENKADTILLLQRDIVDLKTDTTKYRKDLNTLWQKVDKYERTDKEKNKDISSRPPTLDQIKNRK